MDAWDYEQSLDKLGYQPKDNHWLEIWQYEVGTNFLFFCK
jgi:hypothetical protein